MTTAFASIDLTEAIDAAADLLGEAELARALMRAGALSETECLIRCLNAMTRWANEIGPLARALGQLDDIAEEARCTAGAAERAARDIRKLVDR